MEEKELERDPAPVESEKNTQRDRQNKKKNRLVSLLLATLTIAAAFLGGFLTRWFTLDKEMRTLIGVKNKIDREYYEDISDEEFYDAIFEAINNEVLDPYSRYINPDDYAAENASNAGQRSGIGLMFYGAAESAEAQRRIYRVCGNSPAERAGFLVGDFVTGFGVSEREITDCNSFNEFSDFLGQMKSGQTFYVRVEREGEPVLISVAREYYVESYVLYKTNAESYTVTDDEMLRAGEPLTALDGETAYIRLIQFTGDAAELFEEALELFVKQGKKNLVLDLRCNGGGDMRVLKEIAGFLCKDAPRKNPVIAIADYGNKKQYFKAEENEYDEYFSEDSRICVLADKNTASASEALIGAMLDYHTLGYGDICLLEEEGVAKTYGKGIMQTTYIMNPIEKDALKLTTARILWPESGTCIHDRGILASDGTKTVSKIYHADKELTAAIETLFP